MWLKKKVAVILPTYKEKNSIYRAIKEFSANRFVDEIIVVDNNAEKGTTSEVKKTPARLLKEPRQGYGHAVRTGMKNTSADLIIVAEPDGSFDGNDVLKLLAYSDDFDMVFGSRTHLPLIQKGSDMNLLKRYGDVLLGKLVTLLFLCYPLTDLGCTLRLTNKKAWRKIAKECQAVDSILATEWVLAAAKNEVRFIEIPVNYRSRVGRSSVSGTFIKKIIWGIRKFIYIWKAWIYKRLNKKFYD